MGTAWGEVQILDHEGNINTRQRFPKHMVSVNQISVDSKGEYIATCSDDGKVRIQLLDVEGYSLINCFCRFTSIAFIQKKIVSI